MLAKKVTKNNNVQVTFQLPEQIEANSAAVVGEFNNWDREATPMKKMGNVWKTTLELEQGGEYQFRYLVNDSEWLNDWEADKYVPNEFSSDNSVVVT